MYKSELRKIFLERQKNLSLFDKRRKSEQITGKFFFHFTLNNIRFLHCFIAIEKYNEINTTLIFTRLWDEFPHIQTLVPRISFETNEIENIKYSAQTKLIKNVWQINEPDIGFNVDAEEIDLIIVPLICFDKKGFRVGYGKGFYDKLLKNCRSDCLKIGLSYFPPIEKIADLGNFDVKLDFCITPEKLLSF